MSSTSTDPTPAMIERAEAWRKFIDLLNTYFGDAATVLKERSEQSSRLAHCLNEKDVQTLVPHFAPRGKAGVNDVLPTLASTHEQEAKAAARSAQIIGSELKAELAKLSADIEKSISDFHGYSGSFKGASASPTTGTGASTTTGKTTAADAGSNATHSTTTADPAAATGKSHGPISSHGSTSTHPPVDPHASSSSHAPTSRVAATESKASHAAASAESKIPGSSTTPSAAQPHVSTAGAGTAATGGAAASGAGTATGSKTSSESTGSATAGPNEIFKGPLKEQLAQYREAVQAAAAHRSPKVDPYILKLSLDKKVAKYSKSQNRLSDSYAYTQDASREVDAGVSDRLQQILGKYADALGKQGQATLEGSSSLLGGFVAQPKLFEYNHFLTSSRAPKTFRTKDAHNHHKSSHPQPEEVTYPDEDSVYAKAVRTGELERRTRILHSYSAGEYVLTPQSLIELKGGLPAWSLDLNGAKLLDDHKAATQDQFVLLARQHGSASGKQHTFVFRAKVAQNWRRELAAITAGELPPSLESIARAQRSGPEPAGATSSGLAGAGAATTAGVSPGNNPTTLKETYVDAPSNTADASNLARGKSKTGHAKGAEPASAVAGAGGAATAVPTAGTTGRPNAEAYDSTDALPPSSKFNMKSESPKSAAKVGGVGSTGLESEQISTAGDKAKSTSGLGPTPTDPFSSSSNHAGSQQGSGPISTTEQPSVPTSKARTGGQPSANPFGDPPSNESLTGVPVAGAAGVGAATGAAVGSHAHHGSQGPPAYSSNLGRARDEVPTGKLQAHSIQDPSQLSRQQPPSPGVGSKGLANSYAVAGEHHRSLGKEAPYELKEGQLKHPVDKVTTRGPTSDALGATSGGISTSGEQDRALGTKAPYDFKESDLHHSVDKTGHSDPSHGHVSASTGASTGAAAGTVAGGAAGYHGRDPHSFLERAGAGTGQPDYAEHGAQSHAGQHHPATGVAGGAANSVPTSHAGDRQPHAYGGTSHQTAGLGAAATGAGAGVGGAGLSGQHLHAPSHDSDSDVSDTEDYKRYFDGDESEGPRKGTLAWQSQHDMNVFDKPVGYAAYDHRSTIGTTAEGADDNADVWSYDAKHHDGLNTYSGDREFRPADSDLPVHTERRLTNTHHKHERPIVDATRTQEDALDDPESVLQRRRSNVNIQSGGQQRRATGSYGDEDEMKPLHALDSHEKSQILSGGNATAVFDDLPQTTSGKPKVPDLSSGSNASKF